MLMSKRFALWGEKKPYSRPALTKIEPTPYLIEQLRLEVIRLLRTAPHQKNDVSPDRFPRGAGLHSCSVSVTGVGQLYEPCSPPLDCNCTGVSAMSPNPETRTAFPPLRLASYRATSA